MKKSKTICSWSGGKDSCFALMKAMEDGLEPATLLNVLNEEGRISRSHGIPKEILAEQAKAAGLPLIAVESSWKDYEQNFTEALKNISNKHQATHVVFGDIDLQAHRDWEEMVCKNAGLTAVLPLWKRDRKELVLQMLAAGIETMIVSCNEKMGEKYLGKILTKELIDELEALGIDACGENGEYHTLVFNCPLFKNPLKVEVVDRLHHDNYWFSSLEMI